MSIEEGRNHSIVLRCGLNKVTVTWRNGLFDGGFYFEEGKSLLVSKLSVQ